MSKAYIYYKDGKYKINTHVRGGGGTLSRQFYELCKISAPINIKQ